MPDPYDELLALVPHLTEAEGRELEQVLLNVLVDARLAADPLLSALEDDGS